MFRESFMRWRFANCRESGSRWNPGCTRQAFEPSSSYAASPPQEMKHLWGGVVGERLWSWLRGQETPLAPTHRHSMGHSHVLPPELRHASGVYRVAKRLTGRPSVPLRKENFWTTAMILSVRFTHTTGF